jgi:hypothetical protein
MTVQMSIKREYNTIIPTKLSKYKSVVGDITMKRVQLQHAANVTQLVVQGPSYDYGQISESLSCCNWRRALWVL